MTVMTFGAVATIGSLQYTGNLTAVRIDQAVGPGVGSARVTVPRDLRVDAVPGDDVAIELTGESGSSTAAFTGVVLAVRRGLDGTQIRCGDAAAQLAATRSGATYEQQSAAAVIEALVRDAGLSTGTIDLDLDLPTYVADQRRTGWEHVCTLAGWADAVATGTADGAIDVRPFPTAPADTALRYGREIAELVVTTAAPQADRILTGNGPAGNAAAPDARLQTVETLPEDAPAPAGRTIRLAAPALRLPASATAGTTALAAHNGVPRLSARCWLVPGLRAGSTVEIADAPTSGAQGPWLITRVAHSVGPGPVGTTRFEAVSLATGTSDLLGQLLGAVGSLL